MTVDKSVHHPGGFDVHEHGIVVGSPGRSQNPDDVQLERIGGADVVQRALIGD
jgi:hypothetical protein